MTKKKVQNNDLEFAHFALIDENGVNFGDVDTYQSALNEAEVAAANEVDSDDEAEFSVGIYKLVEVITVKHTIETKTQVIAK